MLRASNRRSLLSARTMWRSVVPLAAARTATHPPSGDHVGAHLRPGSKRRQRLPSVPIRKLVSPSTNAIRFPSGDQDTSLTRLYGPSCCAFPPQPTSTVHAAANTPTAAPGNRPRPRRVASCSNRRVRPSPLVVDALATRRCSAASLKKRSRDQPWVVCTRSAPTRSRRSRIRIRRCRDVLFHGVAPAGRLLAGQCLSP